MTPGDVQQILFAVLTQYKVEFDETEAGDSVIYEVPKFGVKIIYLDGQTFDKKILDGWHVVYVHPDYTAKKSKEKIVWALVKGGYFHYMRHNYKNTFSKILAFEGWDKALINERARRYKDLPKYSYFIEINNEGSFESSSYVLSVDPGFYDFIVE
ncbi:MAG: hypothetical protein ACXACY_22175 [Candidatus Hodarchaeales archaeon]|jgi:hypothetical protein